MSLYRPCPDCDSLETTGYHAPKCPWLRPPREETDRWWQAFCACIYVTSDALSPDAAAQYAAGRADAAIAEAKKRNRL